MKHTALLSDKFYKIRQRWNGFFWTFSVLSVACVVGFLFTVIMLGLGKGDVLIMGLLTAGFIVFAAIFAACAYPCYLQSDRYAVLEIDALEREDDVNSFFVGEGTLATFRQEDLFLHGGQADKDAEEDADGDFEPVKKKRDLAIPYYDIKFFSVCTRRAPKEGGRWSVVMQIPARYFNKGAVRDAQPLLVQVEGKPRLYRRLDELGIELSGEPVPKGVKEENAEPQKAKKEENKYTRLQKFVLPDQKRKNKALILVAFGILFLIGGTIAVAFKEISVGSVILLLGVYIVVRALIAFFRARALFFLYQEGVFYSEPTGVDSVFLKWEEFSSIKPVVRDGKDRMRAQCPYGAYDFPMFEGTLKAIYALHPEKEEKDTEEFASEFSAEQTKVANEGGEEKEP